MDTLTLNAQPRETGKKNTKAVRREGLVPCVLYGPDTDPVHFSVEELQLRPLVFTGDTYRVAVDLDGKVHDCIVKDIDFNPISEEPLHIDFRALTEGEKITLDIPVSVIGEAPGMRAGGELIRALTALEIRCLPKDIPGRIAVDISAMQIGDSIHVSDLELGDNVEILSDSERTVVTVSTRTEVEEEPEELELTELEEGEELPEGEEPEEAVEAEEAEEEQE